MGNATANVAADTIKGAASGIGGAIGGGLSHITLGAIGSSLIGNMVDSDSIRYKIRNAIG